MVVLVALLPTPGGNIEISGIIPVIAVASFIVAPIGLNRADLLLVTRYSFPVLHTGQGPKLPSLSCKVEVNFKN